MLVLGEIPTGGLGAQVDQTADNDGGDHGRAHHQAPVETKLNTVIGDEVEGKVGNITHHNTKRCPHLPLLRAVSVKIREDRDLTGKGASP